MTDLRLDAQAVASAVRALLVAYPELADDDDLRLDMIEGETDLAALVARIVAAVLDAESLVDATKARTADLAARRDRIQRRATALRHLVLDLMRAADVRKLELPEGTVSVTPGRASVVVVDLASLPQGTYTTTRIPDKAALKTLLDAGEAIPGADLQPGQPSIRIGRR